MFICYVYGHITVKHKARVTIIEHKEPKILHVKKWKLLCRLHTLLVSLCTRKNTVFVMFSVP